MSVKEEVFRILNENKETYLSGEELADQLGVSRTAVWKAVNSLKDEGYEISGVNKRGYRMNRGNDIISENGIKNYLPQDIVCRLNLEVYKSITSTNTVLKAKASEGAEEWHILVACEQTAGKGRMNRQFYSPADTGIYMSILLRPKFSAEQALLITTMTAVVVAEAIDEILGTDTKIKWVNDIYYNDKKICGILTEAAVNVENAGLDYAVVGIGINVREPKGSFPKDIKNVAGAIVNMVPEERVRDNLRNRIIAKIIEKMYDYYDEIDAKNFMQKYKSKSMLIGREVYILSDENRESLTVLDIDDHAALVIQHADGRIEHLQSGEVSVRVKE